MAVQKKERGAMTVREAGRKGGEVTAQRHGPQFYEEIGRKGGQKVKQLIEQGKRLRGGSPPPWRRGLTPTACRAAGRSSAGHGTNPPAQSPPPGEVAAAPAASPGRTLDPP